MARKKKQSVYELHNQQYYQQQQWASTLCERYPGVASVKINIELKDPDWHDDPKAKELNFRADQKAFFHMQCPYRECVRGGFDFSEGVKEAINSPGNEAAGRILCNGWQDEERINKHRCMLEASYKVTVERC
jgi:hypothetical protein